MTTYLHGRPERQLRARRRALLAATSLAVVGAALAAWWLGIQSQDSITAAPSPTALSDELQRRFNEASGAAAGDGVTLTITSGWRSATEQQRLVDEAVARYGSQAEAHRWVLPPSGSAHVQGRAIDVGPPAGAAWLTEHGAQFGLCRRYANEPWHFEPLVDPGAACPPMYPDSSVGW
ncbi:MAG TPA: M15 family metallopeptidase [Cellulomonas sp.]